MAMRSIAALLLAIVLGWGSAAADPPPQPLSSFTAAKKVARDAIYADRPIDVYCGCSYEPAGASGGTMDWSSCGYQPRSNAERGAQLEWEHVMPAYFFGKDRVCWSEGDASCTGKGRACCVKVDPEFKQIEADLHNLMPAVGELNGNRSNLPYGMVPGETRAYGACNFEIGGTPRRAEPPPSIRGDVARVWFYMSQTYGVPISL